MHQIVHSRCPACLQQSHGFADDESVVVCAANVACPMQCRIERVLIQKSFKRLNRAGRQADENEE